MNIVPRPGASVLEQHIGLVESASIALTWELTGLVIWPHTEGESVHLFVAGDFNFGNFHFEVVMIRFLSTNEEQPNRPILIADL